MDKKVGIFSFFAGAGFLDLGFELTQKFCPVFVNEYHKPFMDVYMSSHKGLNLTEPIFGHHVVDINSFITPKNIQRLKEQISEAKKSFGVTGFIGGPPCPDFSVGGKNKGREGENGKLSGTYVELICKTKPDFFLFENVKGLYRTAKHREFFDSLKLKLIKSGYYITEKLINSLEFGAPQDRERIILLGFQRNVLLDLGFKANGSPLIKNFNWEKHTKYIANEVLSLNWPQQELFNEDSVKPIPLGIPKELTVEHWFMQNEVYNHPNSACQFTPRAGLPKFKVIAEGDDLKKSYKRLHRWRYSPTAAYGNNEVHLHPYKPRRLSVAEALAVQSLPKEFIIPEHISLSDMFKTVGNGVPFLAGKGLAMSIYDFLFDNPIKDLKLSYAEAHGV